MSIPDDTNVLLTHNAPFGILDKTEDGFDTGCPMLLDRVKNLKDLKLHCFGHIHEQYGTLKQDNITFVNGSTCNIYYKPVNKPIVIDL